MNIMIKDNKRWNVEESLKFYYLFFLYIIVYFLYVIFHCFLFCFFLLLFIYVLSVFYLLHSFTFFSFFLILSPKFALLSPTQFNFHTRFPPSLSDSSHTRKFPSISPCFPSWVQFFLLTSLFFFLFSIQVNLYYIQNFPLSSPLLPTSMFSTPFFPCTASCPSSFPVHFPVSL